MSTKSHAAGERTNYTIEARAFADLPPVMWGVRAATLPDPDKVARMLEALAEDSARAAAYLRAYVDGHSHGVGVKRQNAVGRVLRRAFGYTSPKAGDVRW